MSVFAVQPSRPDGHAEKLLLAAVLRRAAYDLAIYKGSHQLLRRRLWMDAYRWMFDDQASHFTSFQSLCTMLDQDPKYIRERSLQLKREDVKKFELVDPYGRV
jgi:hypothetical protein